MLKILMNIICILVKVIERNDFEKESKVDHTKKNQRKVWNEIEYVDDEAEVDGSASEDEDNDYSADEDQISQLVDDTSIQEEQEGFHAAVDAKSGRDSLVALGRGAKRLRRGGILRAAMTFNNSPTTFERAYQRGELDTPSQTPSSLPSSRYLDTDDEDDDVEIIDTPTSGLNAGENISSFSEKPNSLVLDLTEDTPFLKRARKLSNNCSNQKNRLVLDLISPNQPRRSIQPQPTYLNMSHPPQMRPAIIQSTSNSALSDDQRRRIEENRKAALLRRQQRKINTPPPQDSYFGNSLYYDHGWNSTK
uniref:Uncharacterized protein n=1 Tax=Aureoumbra lagunensis TaxID=44058 RepID=A0A6S8BG06_9STRA